MRRFYAEGGSDFEEQFNGGFPGSEFKAAYVIRRRVTKPGRKLFLRDPSRMADSEIGD